MRLSALVQYTHTINFELIPGARLTCIKLIQIVCSLRYPLFHPLFLHFLHIPAPTVCGERENVYAVRGLTFIDHLVLSHSLPRHRYPFGVDLFHQLSSPFESTMNKFTYNYLRNLPFALTPTYSYTKTCNYRTISIYACPCIVYLLYIPCSRCFLMLECTNYDSTRAKCTRNELLICSISRLGTLWSYGVRTNISEAEIAYFLQKKIPPTSHEDDLSQQHEFYV